MSAPLTPSPREQRATSTLVAQFIRELAAQAAPVAPLRAGAAA